MSIKKILVVDDLVTNRKLLRQMLERIDGYVVFEAVDGKEAIDLYEKENPDLILMDINMPEMDGLSATTEIKKNAGDIYTPIIFVTAFSAESALKNALASGGDDFIGKPFDADILKSKISAHLRIRELNQQLGVKNKELNSLNNNLVREQELIEHFFNSALEQSFLDKTLINYHMSSMSAFNGDIFLVGRSPKGGLHIVMGDFTGHGLTAAMGTLPVAMIFFKMVESNASVEDIAYELNSQLYKLMPLSMFFAATLLELNEQGDILTTWMGGMPECYWIGGNGDLKGTIESQHMPLGILNESDFDSSTEIYNVSKNDKLYLYSDGIIEAESQNGEMFGSERLKDVLISNSDDCVDNVLRVLNEFRGTIEQNDDITLVELLCRPVPNIEKVEDAVVNTQHDLPWTMSISLSATDMRNKDPIPELAEVLGSLPALKRHKGVIEILLSEIYLNALDYSILNLDGFEKENEEQFGAYYEMRDEKLRNLKDASIKFDLTYSSANDVHQFVIRMQDNGKGYHGHKDSLIDNSLHGRGLEIVKSLCEHVEFSNEGRSLELVYRL